MRHFVFVCLLTSFYSCTQQQAPAQNRTADAIDTVPMPRLSFSVYNQADTTVKQVVNAYNNWYKAFLETPDDNPYWAKSKYVRPDVWMYYLTNRSVAPYYKPTILAVQRKGEFFIVKTLFSDVDSSGYALPLGIYNTLLKKEGNNYKVDYILDYNTENWKIVNIHNIHFHFSPDYKFNAQLARKTVEFNQELAQKFKTNPVDFEYYVCSSDEEIFRIIGFDYRYDMFTHEQSGGLTDVFNSMIFAGNASEWYPHEIVHLYVKEQFSETAHTWFDEGIATFFGGSKEKDLAWHLKELRNYLEHHPEINLEDLFSHTGLQVGAHTGFSYAIGGLFCKIMYEREGMEGVFKLLQGGKNEADFYATLENVVGIERENLDNFIKQQLLKE